MKKIFVYTYNYNKNDKSWFISLNSVVLRHLDKIKEFEA